jgi:hypothetical protein
MIVLIIWVVFWFHITIKVSSLLLVSELSFLEKVSKCLYIFGYLFLFWSIELIEFLNDKSLWEIKWHIKFRL